MLLAAARNAEGYVVKRTAGGELVHWEEPTVRYTIDPSVDRAVNDASAATLDAMKSWSGTVGAPELEVAPITGASPTSPGFDRKNGVFYMTSGYEPAGRALAITVLTYDNRTGKILDADILFNGNYRFEVLEPTKGLSMESVSAAHPSNTDGVEHGGTATTIDRSRPSIYDLHHVIAHELGHSLGMNDELGRKDALMYRYSAPNDASIRDPGSDDIAGLAELYSATLEARGNGCGSATVAPRRPPSAASHAATIASLGLLVFLVARAKSGRRARVAFVLATTALTVMFVPKLSGTSGPTHASASASAAVGHARARVLGTSTAVEGGLFKTTFSLATTSCRTASCPTSGHGVSWGGTVGNVTQEVGNDFAPRNGDEVDVSFAELPKPLSPITTPLAGRAALQNVDAKVRIVTRAMTSDAVARAQ